MNSVPLVRTNTDIARGIEPMHVQRGPNLEPAGSSRDSVLREYLRILIKRKWIVLASWVTIFAVVAISTLRKTPIYEAVGSIAIAKSIPSMLNFQGSSGNESSYDDSTDLDTEARILHSDLLALLVIRQLDLDKLPQFGGNKDGDEESLDLTTRALQPNSAATSNILAAFKDGLRISTVPGTRIVEIHYRSPDKDLAARVVNTLMNAYKEQTLRGKYESTMQASDWLTKQLLDLQIKVETSQEKLVKYQREHGILGIDEKQNIITSKLDELNKELTIAESDRMLKEADYQLVKSPDPSIAAIAAVNAESSGGHGGSELLEKLRLQQGDLKVQIAQLSAQFGASYPKIVQLNNQLKEVNGQLDSEVSKSVGRVRGEYLAAVSRENMLRDAMEKQKQQANQLNESGIQYSFLKRDLETNRTLYEGLLQKLKEAGVSAGLKSTNFRTVDVARVPSSPVEPDVRRGLLSGLMWGLAVGVGLAFLVEGFDNTVRTPEEAQLISGLPSLGMIPLESGNGEDGTSKRLPFQTPSNIAIVTQSRPHSQIAESYRALRTSLLLSSLGSPPKVILVTSALPQEGKTTTSVNCAIVLAQKGSRVLLIDADMRRPGVHKTLGFPGQPGLSNVLTGNAALEQVAVGSPMLPNLFVIPAGNLPPNPAELLVSSNMREMIVELRKQYDHIVIDTPPTLSVTDAVVVSTIADAVVLVIRSGQTTKHALRRSRDLLLSVNAPISGILLNAADLRSPDYYYYYGKYGSDYYHQEVAGTSETEELVGLRASGTKSKSNSA